ncbi:auxin efflux carrier family protein [Pelomyxa schiedti]|nr:auxin efflux carrier family protein [Pelomyxa schiedti]
MVNAGTDWNSIEVTLKLPQSTCRGDNVVRITRPLIVTAFLSGFLSLLPLVYACVGGAALVKFKFMPEQALQSTNCDLRWTPVLKFCYIERGIVYPVLFIVVGFIAAKILTLVLCHTRFFATAKTSTVESLDEKCRAVILNFMFINCGFLPYMIVVGIFGFAYITIFCVPQTVLMWTWGYNYMNTAERLYKNTEDDVELEKVETSSDNSHETITSPKKASRCPQSLFKVKETLARLLTLNNASLAFSLTIGLIPWTKSLFVEGGTLRFVWTLCNSIGAICTPLSNLVLGGTLSKGPNNKEFGFTFLIACLIIKVVICLAICLGCVVAGILLGLVRDEPLFKLVLCIECATPSAVVLVMLSQKCQVSVSSIPTFQFWQNLFCLITMGLTIALSLQYIISPDGGSSLSSAFPSFSSFSSLTIGHSL